MNTHEISRKASSIAGALWDDRDKTGTLAEQLRAVAAEPAHGTDGDLTDGDRAALRDLADQVPSNRTYFGFSQANASDEPAWFHTQEAAERFALACGWKGATIETTDDADPADIMDTPETPWAQ